MQKTKIIMIMLCILALHACAPRNPDKIPYYYLRVDQMFPGDSQTQALALAASKGETKKIDKLVEAGADVNATGRHGLPVLIWPLWHPNKAGFRRLLELGADPDHMYGEKMLESVTYSTVYLAATPFAKAIDSDYVEMVLQDGNANPNLPLPNGWRPIEATFTWKNKDLFAILYNAGAEIDYVDSKGISLLEKAYSDFELIYFMITHGADFNYENKEFNKRSCDYSKSIGSHCLNESGPDVREFNIRGYFSWAKDFYSDKEGLQKIAKDMWFWRCIDFLEKHGMDCRLPPNVDSIRPKGLPTTPTGYEIEIEKWKNKHAN